MGWPFVGCRIEDRAAGGNFPGIEASLVRCPVDVCLTIRGRTDDEREILLARCRQCVDVQPIISALFKHTLPVGHAISAGQRLPRGTFMSDGELHQLLTRRRGQADGYPLVGADAQLITFTRERVDTALYCGRTASGRKFND